MQILKLLLHNTEPETTEKGAQMTVFRELSQWFWCRLILAKDYKSLYK